MAVGRLQKKLVNLGVDLCVLMHPDTHVSYLIGGQSLSYGVLLVWQDKCELLASVLDSVEGIDGVEVINYTKDWIDSLLLCVKKKFGDANTVRIGINKSAMTASFFEKLQKKLGALEYPVEFVDINSDIVNLRLIKSNSELEKMRKAAAIADTALSLFIENFRSGGLDLFPREIDVALFLEGEIRRQGAELSFPCIAAFGKNSAIPHHIPGLTALGKGFLLIDFGAKFEGYCSDMTRMLYIGEPDEFELMKYELLLSVQKSCVEVAREDMKCFDLDAHARKLLGDDETYFIHTLGHGIGSEVHEKPRLSKDPANEDVLLGRMPFTIEPGVYYPEKFGLRIEDTCVFIDGKLKRLTRTPKELVLLPPK